MSTKVLAVLAAAFLAILAYQTAAVVQAAGALHTEINESIRAAGEGR